MVKHVTQVTNFGRSGAFDWLYQRLTAIILAAYTLFIIGYLVCHPNVDFSQWKALFGQTWVMAFSSLAILATVIHAWVGLWTVTTDYFSNHLMENKGTVLRLISQAAYSLILFVYLVWGLQIVWG